MAACQTSDVKSCTSLFEPFTSMEIESALESIGTQVSCEQLWLPVVRYHVFRLMLAPAIETVILLDRLLWLQERGHPCCLVRLFDYGISPRNLALVALRF
ncbi:unnamed protein product [Dicrocoelium dendriticum]|nr:unnamed protein product [Dicrocoelium dendriticum]